MQLLILNYLVLNYLLDNILFKQHTISYTFISGCNINFMSVKKFSVSQIFKNQ